MVKTICKTCGTDIFKYQSQIDNGEGKYCSKKCYTDSMKGIDLFTDETRGHRNYSLKVEITCKFCDKLFEIVPSELSTRKYCSKECMIKHKEPKIKDLKYFRDTVQYKQWRIAVYRRDGFKCQSCGQVGKNLNAHHMVPIAVDITKIYDMSNGITLCKDCHILTHKHYRPIRKQGELLGYPL